MIKFDEPIICDEHELIETDKALFWMNTSYNFFFSCDNCINCGKCSKIKKIS